MRGIKRMRCGMEKITIGNFVFIIKQNKASLNSYATPWGECRQKNWTGSFIIAQKRRIVYEN